MPDVLVINASPLIFLGNANRLDLLLSLGAPRIIVPEPVYTEVVETTHADRATRSVVEANWLERLDSSRIPAKVIEWDLGPGESSVIAMALKLDRARAVIDDLSGRKCALSLNVEVMGCHSRKLRTHRNH